MTIKTITKDNFDAEVINSQIPVIVEFWAPWCGYCRRISPVLDRLSEKLGDDIQFGKINVDEQSELEDRFSVEIIPTFLLFQSGRHGDRLIAPSSQSQIEDWLQAQRKP